MQKQTNKNSNVSQTFVDVSSGGGGGRRAGDNCFCCWPPLLVVMWTLLNVQQLVYEEGGDTPFQKLIQGQDIAI